MNVWRPKLVLAIAALALLFTACGGDGLGPEEGGFGFPPIPTRTPYPTSTPITELQRTELCPNLPSGVHLGGDKVNLYEQLELSSAVNLQVFHDGAFDGCSAATLASCFGN